MLDGFIKFIIATSKIHSEEEASLIIKEKLKEVINSKVDECLSVVSEQEKHWGDVSIRVSRITKDLIKKILSFKINE